MMLNIDHYFKQGQYQKNIGMWMNGFKGFKKSDTFTFELENVNKKTSLSNDLFGSKKKLKNEEK